MQISVVAKADLRRVLLEAAGEIAGIRSKVLATAAKVAQTRDAAEAGDLALRNLPLMGSPIDRDMLAGSDEVAVLNAAFDALAGLAQTCRDIEGMPAFMPSIAASTTAD